MAFRGQYYKCSTIINYDSIVALYIGNFLVSKKRPKSQSLSNVMALISGFFGKLPFKINDVDLNA